MEKLYKKIQDTTEEYLSLRKKEYRKKYSQFFTPLTIAKIMVSKIRNNKLNEIKILEPAAGTGMLIYVLVLKLIKQNVKKIDITAIEMDLELHKILKDNLLYLKNELYEKGIIINFIILNTNFIEYFGENWEKNNILEEEKYDIIISNPPYKKINKDSKENIYFKNFIKGQPNLYHLFIALSLKLLKKNGEYIVLSPKNYLGGKYTENLRKFIFDNFSIVLLHFFTKRNEIFGNEVLQEICITKIEKKVEEKVEISYDDNEMFRLNFNEILLKNQFGLIFPKSKSQLINLNNRIAHWKTLKEQELMVNVGKVVQFRILEIDKRKEKYEKIEDGVPLYIVNHIKRGKIDYKEVKIGEKNKNITLIKNERTKTKLIKNENYVIFRKNIDYESKTFFKAAVHKKDNIKSEYLAIDNNLGYIKGEKNTLNIEKANKICDYLNSLEFEEYYKLICHSHTINNYDLQKILFPIF